MTTATPLSVVILAAGQGTRMQSKLPKVLHPLAGRPLLSHVLDTARDLAPERILVVYGHGGEQVPMTVAARDVQWVEQAEQLGTGHAVEQAMPAISDDGLVLVLYGDVPLVQAATLRKLVARAAETGFALLTVCLDEPAGYGRIVRDETGRVTRIVEQKDASPEELAIGEVNTGILCARAADLRRWLGRLENANAQGEFYLTDTIAMAVGEGIEVATARPNDVFEVLGVNSRRQLAQLERHYQRQQAGRLMESGVSLADPARLDVRGEVTAGRDVFIDANVILEGRVIIGDDVRIGAGCVIRDAEIGPGTQIRPYSVIEEARIESQAQIGPFARLRPGTELATDARIGNFVEVKNSRIGEGSKVNHLSYIGDTDMGAAVNIGAGTITCNYDGANKHRTVIGDGAFIGSDTQLVAPVTVGENATLGAGTTLTSDAPANELTLSRAKQKSIPGWKRPAKKRGEGRGTKDE